jgi:hypothetical protein
MCTVTFSPGKESIYFTSGHDEKTLGHASAIPAVLELSSGKVICPNTEEGAWIAGHENGNVAVFLDAAYVPHVAKPPYRKFRGLILLDLIDHYTPLNCFLAVNLNNVEPFTAIIRDNRHLFECYWNGKQKDYEEVDASLPAIWGSANHFDEQAMEKKRTQFKDFTDTHPEPSQKDIIAFHQAQSAKAITYLDIGNDALHMHYLDVQNNKRFSEQVKFDSSMAGK